MMTYSVAIRTLGTAGDKFRRELVSLHRQTIQPDKIVVYIAEGYPRPEIQIGVEEYVWVKKGMVAQRALQYREIDSDCILLLDDDVELAPDSAERMLKAMQEYGTDCVGADTFKNQDLPFKTKVFAALTNWVTPHFDSNWAFKIRCHGSFSYLNNPTKSFYWSQSCAGPCSMWKKDVFRAIKVEDELWLDRLGFPYGEDMITFYKLHVNGYKLGILYDSGVTNLDGKSSSGDHHSNVKKYLTRSKGSFLIWWRCCYQSQHFFFGKLLACFFFLIKFLWLFLVNILAIVPAKSVMVPFLYVQGIFDAMRFVSSKEAKQIPNYILKR